MSTETSELELQHFSEESGGLPPLSLRLQLKVAKKLNDLARRPDGTVNRRLSDMIELKVPARETLHHGTFSKDVVIDEASGVWVRLFFPHEKASAEDKDGAMKQKKKPVVFYFHGGGFAVLCANWILYDIFCRRLCRRCQVVVISVNYRRSPEHRYPVAYDDCYRALEWLKEKGEGLYGEHMDVGRCFLMGDSAGGNIAHHLACRASTENLTPLKIAGSLLLFPFFGGEERTPSQLRLSSAPLVSLDNSDWYWKAFLPPGASRDHPACNVFGPLATDPSALHLPPFLVAIAEYDPLKDWELRYVQNLRKAGKQVELLYYKGGLHAFHIFNAYKLSSKILSDLKDFMDSHC